MQAATKIGGRGQRGDWAIMFYFHCNVLAFLSCDFRAELQQLRAREKAWVRSGHKKPCPFYLGQHGIVSITTREHKSKKIHH